ncbi:hypothetical protein psal_cds_1417 [Pandoravirus salinus]|uniref:Uncharacterized protein n=1 Tax=Pandoravirus salinus TaxID=1349410 RepID=S4VZQ1_9VIRU|nr:hypothetical protein psal_cds_1417 [Pandoravirus salinus]AGO85853.1 hypothetical protein psal_cds_1417 [Pandoravirus salinus]
MSTATTSTARDSYAKADLCRFPLLEAPYSKYVGPIDPYGAMPQVMGVFLGIVFVVVVWVDCVARIHLGSYLIATAEACAAIALVASVLGAVHAYGRWARRCLERHRAAIRAVLDRHAPGAYVHANVTRLTTDSYRAHEFFVMVDLESPESKRGAVVYDLHQVRAMWPHLLADRDWLRLFDRVKVTKKSDDSLRATAAAVDYQHTIYTAKRDVADFAPFLSAAARADIHMQQLVR